MLKLTTNISVTFLLEATRAGILIVSFSIGRPTTQMVQKLGVGGKLRRFSRIPKCLRVPGDRV
jgi:hypothetical protein